MIFRHVLGLAECYGICMLGVPIFRGKALFMGMRIIMTTAWLDCIHIEMCTYRSTDITTTSAYLNKCSHLTTAIHSYQFRHINLQFIKRLPKKFWKNLKLSYDSKRTAPSYRMVGATASSGSGVWDRTIMKKIVGYFILMCNMINFN